FPIFQSLLSFCFQLLCEFDVALVPIHRREPKEFVSDCEAEALWQAGGTEIAKHYDAVVFVRKKRDLRAKTIDSAAVADHMMAAIILNHPAQPVVRHMCAELQQRS